MRIILLAAILFTSSTTPNFSQERFVNADYSDYYDWFHERSQTEVLYQHRSTLYIFGDEVSVYDGPCRQSARVTRLKTGQPVTNIVTDDYYFPEDEIDGYGDIWYQVSGKDASGREFSGYVWGAHIAKSWQSVDLNGDRRSEFIMLGVSSQPRVKPRDIRAEIRILAGQTLVYQTTVPELCVFEDCASSTLLRVLPGAPGAGNIMIEASTMTVGCWAGIEKAFFYWDGQNLDRVFHAEYTTHKEYLNKSFKVKTPNDQGTSYQLCRYSHEDADYNPVWDCQTVKSAPANPAKPAAVAVRNSNRAR